MASKENIYKKIQDLFADFEGNLSIMEDQIDFDTQAEYFNYTKNIDKQFDPEDIIRNKEDIFRQHLTEEDKKCMLVQLASIASVEAFRTIERYASDPDHNLQDWAKLALKESKLLLESKILDENQVLISTGLGGKDLKLRYSVAFIARNNQSLSGLQKKIIMDELHYAMKKNNGETEEIKIYRNIVAITSLIPLQVSVQSLFDHIISEINQLGNFLYRNYLITNVKILTLDEIREFISVYHNQLK
ncbi:MAG: hypothetical protein JW723_04740 [Bacteroidales bacterium]|nr:hypothetical protein [Bacteroidales bacterium]